MRTWKMIINPKKNKQDAAFCQYFKTNTADFKCMYNVANFYIRNTMTGIKKSPEERTHLETEVLHYVFTGIQKANEVIGQKRMKKKFEDLKLAQVGGMNCAIIAYSLASQEPFQYPTAKKWFLPYNTLDAIFKFTDNPVYKRMNSQVNQNAIRKVIAAWEGYFESLKQYRINPAGYTGKPKIPGYKNTEESTAWFSKQVAKLKEEDGKYYLQFVNQKEKLCIGKASIYKGLQYVKTEIKPVYGRYCLLVTFDDKVKAVEPPVNPERILGLDPGVSNFLGAANNFGAVPFVIKGGAVKSVNQRFNKRRSALMSALTKGSDSQHSVKYSEQLNALSKKRDSFMRDYFYKCAWYICRYAQAAGVEVIVMGHNEGQKQEIDIKDNANQNFVSIPYTKFITILKTVASKCGIAVVIREESYTSQASLLDMDDIPTYKKGENKRYTFSGKRIHRGLYRSKNGTLLNADINGAANILRKEYPNAFDGIKDFTYLCVTTISIGYKDLYKNAKAYAGRPKPYKYHKSGKYTVVRHMKRSHKKCEYCKLWGKGKFVWRPDQNKQDTQHGKAA